MDPRFHFEERQSSEIEMYFALCTTTSGIAALIAA